MTQEGEVEVLTCETGVDPRHSHPSVGLPSPRALGSILLLCYAEGSQGT